MKTLLLAVALGLSFTAQAGQLEDNLTKVGQIKFINEKCGYSNTKVNQLERLLSGDYERSIKQSIPTGYAQAKAVSSSIKCGSNTRAQSKSINTYVTKLQLML